MHLTSFSGVDGCNTCKCTEGGISSCTKYFFLLLLYFSSSLTKFVRTQCFCDEGYLDFDLDFEDDFDFDLDQHHKPPHTKWCQTSPSQHVFLEFDAGDATW